MGLSFFTRQVRALWLCVFFCIGASGIGCAQRDSAKSQVVATPVVAVEGTLGAAEAKDVVGVTGASRDGGVNNAEKGKGGEQKSILDYLPVAAIIALGALLLNLSKGFPNNLFVKNEKKTNRTADDDYDRNKKDKEYEEHEIEYRKWLKIKLEKSTIIGMPEGIFDETQEAVNLRDTFVPPHLTVSVAAERKTDAEGIGMYQHSGEDIDDSPEKILADAASKFRLLLIIGEPGSGKTTLLQHFAMLNTLELPGFSSPIIIRYLPFLDMAARGEEQKSLPEKFSESLKSYSQIDHSFFDDCLKRQSTLVLLDGLDEISDPEQREKVCTWVAQKAEWFDKAFFVMTTRDKGYGEKEQNALRTEKQKAIVERFSSRQQMEFLIKWFRAAFFRDQMRDEGKCTELRKKEIEVSTERIAKITAQELVEYLEKKENKGLKDLAGVPLLLQIMAILWKQSGALPENREKLYCVTLDYLLYHRDKGRKIPTLLPAEEAKLLLAPIALWMLDKGHKMAPKVEMNEIMQDIIDTMALKYRNNSSEKVCKYFVERAGVLRDLGAGYEFSHKTFQEYLAAIQLLKSVTSEAGRMNNLVMLVGNQWWAESLLFFIAQVDADWFNSFMEAFFDSTKSDVLDEGELTFLKTMIRSARLQPVTVFRKKLLEPTLLDPSIIKNRQRYLLECLLTIGSRQAVDAAQEFKQQNPDADLEILRKADEVIVITADNSVMTVCPEVQQAETRLLNIDTQQRRPDVFQSAIEPGAQYILIKGGRYLYSVYGEEKIVNDLYVAKYPVTNRLYRRFIMYLQFGDIGDVFSKAHQLPVTLFREKLSAMGRQIEGYSDYLNSEQNIEALFRSNRDDDRRFKEDDQPVVGITWYAARAYCLWLSLAEGGEDNRYRLPTEIEWEWASGGRQGKRVQNVRPYPWLEAKGEPSSRLANYGETVGATTPVGSYPEGITPEGLYDMAGNVWEWMDNKYKENTSARALRGGSWFNDPGLLRCSARSNVDPALRYDYIGFRVVRSSPSS